MNKTDKTVHCITAAFLSGCHDDVNCSAVRFNISAFLSGCHDDVHCSAVRFNTSPLLCGCHDAHCSAVRFFISSLFYGCHAGRAGEPEPGVFGSLELEPEPLEKKTGAGAGAV